MRFTEAVSVYPALQTSRFVLRRPTDQDIPSIVEIAGHWEIASRLARVPYPYDADAARFFVDVVVPAELAWAIIERETNAMVGIAGLAPDEDEPGRSVWATMSRETNGAGA